MIKRVINNLLYNSIAHNKKGKEIEVRLEKKDRLHIFIKDKGKGMSQEEVEHIFERYYRGTNTSGNHKGSGLGMAIANDIVKAHGGLIKIKSKIDVGTEVEIIL